MKKIILFTIIFIILSIFNSGCSGYKPIYATSNFNFKIEQHTIEGDVELGNLIYRKLNNISLSNKNNPKARSIELSIGTTKERKPTVKDGSGNILEYEINLNTDIIINDQIRLHFKGNNFKIMFIFIFFVSNIFIILT